MEVLHTTTDLWQKLIIKALEKKHQDFGKTANRLWDFLGKDYKQLYLERPNEQDDELPHLKGPYYKTRRNLAADFVAVMLPHLHYKVPNRQVTPDPPPCPPEIAQLLPSANDPMRYNQQVLVAYLLQSLLNWLPRAYGLDPEVRKVLPEALVKGCGVAWHEIKETAAGTIPVSTYDSVDNLICDPDARSWREAGWIGHIRTRSIWRVAEDYRRSREQLKGKYSSFLKQVSDELRGYLKQPADQQDVCVYVEIFSRAGLGQNLGDWVEGGEDLRRAMDRAGHNVYLAIMPGLDEPLNLPSEIMTASEQSLREQAIAWPIPFWADDITHNPWPCTRLEFLPGADVPWPRPPLEACLPLLSFIDQAYSYLCSRVRSTCRDIIVTSDALSDALKVALESGLDQEIVSIADPNIREAVQNMMHVIQFPALNKDVYTVVAMFEQAFERSSGMSPLLFGAQPGPTQVRSSAEYQGREAAVSSRPQDFADMVESWHSDVSTKEAMIARLYTGPDVIARLFGEEIAESPFGQVGGPLTQAWSELVQTDDPYAAGSQMRYTVEAGSGRRKNKQKLMADAQEITKTLLPIVSQWAMQGILEPYNNLMALLAEALDMPYNKLAITPDMLVQAQQRMLEAQMRAQAEAAAQGQGLGGAEQPMPAEAATPPPEAERI